MNRTVSIKRSKAKKSIGGMMRQLKARENSCSTKWHLWHLKTIDLNLE